MKTIGDLPHSLCRYSENPHIAKSSLPFGLSINGPTIMFERTLFSQHGVHYRTDVGAADDYLFVVECSKYRGISTLPEVLYLYRKHSAQITNTQRDDQHEFSKRIRLKQLEQMGLHPSDDEIVLHEAICMWQVDGDRDHIRKIEEWLVKLKSTNLRTGTYPKRAFAQVVADHWFSACTRNTKLGLWVYNTFFNSSLARDLPLEAPRKLKFFVKCAARQLA
jgi:hypothetical protein